MSKFLAMGIICLVLFIITVILWKREQPKMCTFFLVWTFIYIETMLTELLFTDNHPDRKTVWEIINILILLGVLFIVFRKKVWRFMPGYQYSCCHNCTQVEYNNKKVGTVKI